MEKTLAADGGEKLGKNLEPIYQSDKAIIGKCIIGLTQYEACLAAEHQDAQIPELRQRITDMAEFWDLDYDELYYTWPGNIVNEKKID